MSLMACSSCSTRFAVGLLRCPQCQAMSEMYARPDHEVEETMPKITVGGGASNAAEDGKPDAVVTTLETSAAANDEQAVADESAAKHVEPEGEPVAPAPKKRTAKKAPTSTA